MGSIEEVKGHITVIGERVTVGHGVLQLIASRRESGQLWGKLHLLLGLRHPLDEHLLALRDAVADSWLLGIFIVRFTREAQGKVRTLALHQLGEVHLDRPDR